MMKIVSAAPGDMLVLCQAQGHKQCTDDNGGHEMHCELFGLRSG